MPAPISEMVNGHTVEHWNTNAQRALVQKVDDITSDRFALSGSGFKFRKLSTLMVEGNPAICVEIEDAKNGSDQWRAGLQSVDDVCRGMTHHGMVYSYAYHYTAEGWHGARLFFVPFTSLIPAQ